MTAAQSNTIAVDAASASPWGTPLLEDISFALAPGEILVLAGPNGAGKSSLLQLLSGDIPVDSGEILFRGHGLQQWALRDRARHLAYLPQMSLLNFPYTVEEVVLLGRTPHDSGRAADAAVVERVLQQTDMLALRRRLYTQLSGGEKQRTQLARVYAQIDGEESLAGKLLLLDEPTSALDLLHQQQLLDTIRLLATRGCTVILVIHDLNLASSIADHILVLSHGRQVALGKPQDVFTAAMFEDVFAVSVDIVRQPGAATPLIMPRSKT